MADETVGAVNPEASQWKKNCWLPISMSSARL